MILGPRLEDGDYAVMTLWPLRIPEV